MISKITTYLNQTLLPFLKDKRLWLALVAGLALTFSYAPFGYWFVAPLSISVLCYCLVKTPPKTAGKYGFIFGLGWFGAGISWVHVSIADFGGLPLVASLALMALLVSYLALYPALAAWLSGRYQQWFGKWNIAAFLLFFSVAELLRGTLFTGFPWLTLGYSQTDSPLHVFAPLIGEFGLAAVVLLLGYALYATVCLRRIYALIFSTLLLAGGWFSQAYWQQNSYTGKHVSTLLVQGNIAQSLRWQPELFAATMEKYRHMTAKNWGAELIFWPEAAIPEIEPFAHDFLAHLDYAVATHNAALVTGIIDYQLDSKTAYNALITLGNKQKYQGQPQGHYQYLHPNRYRKHQLLPIGEFVPFADLLRPIAPLFDLPMSSFTRGDQVQPNLIANGYHILPAICYEIVFANLVRGNYRPHSDILFTVSNDAWFGNSIGPHQHMQIARMRALELMRPLVRVTNTGVTGVYDPLSQQGHYSEQFHANVLRHNLALINGNSLYSQWGNTPTWVILTLFSLLTSAYLWRAASSNKPRTNAFL